MHFLNNLLLLSATTGAVLMLAGICGLVWVHGLLPRRHCRHWPVLAPVAGLVWFTVTATPTAWLGIPVGTSAPFLILPCLLAGVFTLMARTCGRRGFRHLKGSLLNGIPPLLAIAAVVVTVCTWMATRTPGGRVDDAWGSSDYFAYWTVAEYVREFGADPDDYAQQGAFHNSDIHDHLHRHARLGDMALVALLARALPFLETHQVLLPLMSAALVLMTGVFRIWLREHDRTRQALVVLVLFHPFLYFLAYYTYVSQALGVLFFVAAVTVVDLTRQTHSANRLRSMILTGVLTGAALLTYPSIWVCAGLFGALLAARDFPKVPAFALGVGAVTLATSGYYWPQILRELAWLWQLSELPGWEWRGLIGSLEFVGLRSVLGYQYLPETRGIALRTVDLLLAVACMGAGWRILQRWRSGLLAPTLLVCSAILILSAVLKLRDGIPNATHGLVKMASAFAPFLTALFAGALAASLPVRVRRTVLAVVILGGLAGQCWTLSRSQPQWPQVRAAFARQVREELHAGLPVEFDPPLPRYAADALMRHDRFWLPPGHDHEGPYLKIAWLPDAGATHQIIRMESRP